jgi:hypothetical protein
MGLPPLIFVLGRPHEPVDRPAVKSQTPEADGFDGTPPGVYVNRIRQLDFPARPRAKAPQGLKDVGRQDVSAN